MSHYTTYVFPCLWNSTYYWLSLYWFISTCLPCLQSNNEVRVPVFPTPIKPSFQLNSDDAAVVQRKALDQFKVSNFTSYTEIRPVSSTVSLVLRQRENTAGKMIKGKKIKVTGLQ